MKRMRPFTVAEENDTIFYGKVSMVKYIKKVL